MSGLGARLGHRRPWTSARSSASRQGCWAAYTFTLSEDGVTVEERSADGADSRVRGTVEAWVKSFSPERDRTGLQLGGEQSLAEALLDGLSAQGRRASAGAREAA